METQTQKGKLNQPCLPLYTKAINIVRFVGLLMFLLVATSHESANPKLGSTAVDFFATTFKTELKSQHAHFTKYTDSNIALSDSLLIWGVYEIYRQNDYLPIWTINFDTCKNYTSLVKLISKSHNYGLNPENYSLDKLSNLEKRMGSAENDSINLANRLNFEYQATYYALLFSINMAIGLNAPDTNINSIAAFKHIVGTLAQEGFKTNNEAIILALQPNNLIYQNLQQALENYVRQAKIGENKIVVTKNSNAGDLALYFDNYWRIADSVMIDSAFVTNSIKKFQTMHGLTPNGKLTMHTVNAMNVSTKYRYYQAALNLDRLRKSDINTQQSIFVNIPEYKLHIFNHGKIIKQHVVVVGSPRTPTPEIESAINRVVANPYWTVPKSIAHNEIIPKLIKDSTYLKRNGYEVVDKFLKPVDASGIEWETVTSGEFKYWFKQNKGRGNALGVVKFLFPNAHSVYLHDTPSKTKFMSDIRAYSHGCIRVQQPEELAEYVVANFYKKEETDVKGLIKKRIHKNFELDTELPVYLKYYTCSADSLKNIVFHKDIYKKDKEEMKKLFPEFNPS